MAVGGSQSNIYTVLAFIALIALLMGIVFLCIRSSQMFETGNPFKIVDTKVAAMTEPLDHPPFVLRV